MFKPKSTPHMLKCHTFIKISQIKMNIYYNKKEEKKKECCFCFLIYVYKYRLCILASSLHHFPLTKLKKKIV